MMSTIMLCYYRKLLKKSKYIYVYNDRPRLSPEPVIVVAAPPHFFLSKLRLLAGTRRRRRLRRWRRTATMVMAIAIFTTTTAAVRPRKRSAASFTRPLYYLARSAALFLSLFLLFVKKFWFWVSKLFSVMCGGKKRGFDRSCIDFCDCYLVL